MIKKTLAIISFVMIIVPSIATADKVVWRDWGIGGMIFSDTSWAAIISNIIWDLGTTATSSNICWFDNTQTFGPRL